MGLNLVSTISLNSAGFEHGAERVVERLKEMAIAGIGIASIEQAYERTIKTAMEFADTVTKGAERLGVTTDEFQRLNYAAILGETNIEKVSSSFDRLANSKEKALGKVGSGSDAEMDTAARAFESFAISIDEVEKLTPDELFSRIGESIRKTGVNANVTANLMALMGRGAGELIPMLKELEENKGKGAIVNKDDIETLSKMEDQLKSIGANLNAGISTVVAMASRGLKQSIGDILSGDKNRNIATRFFEFIGVGVDDKAFGRIRQMRDQLKVNQDNALFVARGNKNDPDDFRYKEPRGDAKKILDIEREISAEKLKGNLAGKTAEQKRVELLKEIKDLETRIKYAQFEGLTELETKELELQLQRDKTMLKKETKLAQSHPKIDSDSLVKVGNFLGSSRGAINSAQALLVQHAATTASNTGAAKIQLEKMTMILSMMGVPSDQSKKALGILWPAN